MASSYFKPEYLERSIEMNNLLSNHLSQRWIKIATDYLAQNRGAKGGFVLSNFDLKELAPKSRGCLTYQIGSFISYMTDECNLPSLTCKDTLISDKNRGNETEFYKTENWIKAFPNYTTKCNVTDYLKDGSFDFIICRKNKVIEDNSLIVYSDNTSEYKFVYKK